jgi:hypothetical protein
MYFIVGRGKPIPHFVGGEEINTVDHKFSRDELHSNVLIVRISSRREVLVIDSYLQFFHEEFQDCLSGEILFDFYLTRNLSFDHT